MEEIKTKFLDLIHKQNRQVKIPSMGFSEYFGQGCAIPLTSNDSVESVVVQGRNVTGGSSSSDFRRLPDQEIIDGMEEIYLEEGANCEEYELEKFVDSTLDYGTVEHSMMILKQQHKVVSKKVLQNILDQRGSCTSEFELIAETQSMLATSLDQCRTARSQLHLARTNLTVNSLEILATYKKRDTLHGLLRTLHTIRRMRQTERRLQDMLAVGDYSGAIAVLLDCRQTAEEYAQYNCVQALTTKLQDTMMLTELQLDVVLNEMTLSFDSQKYASLQGAYKLLGKTLIATDQLHMNFISAIHSTSFTVLRKHNEPTTADDKQKLLFEQICENVPADKYISCFIELCKSFWSILVCYYQVTIWHQNAVLACQENTNPTTDRGHIESSSPTHDDYVQQKFRNGQLRLWNDIQSKCCVYLASTKLHQLKYEHFIQVLAIVQRLKKVGTEFCGHGAIGSVGDPSANLMDGMRTQSVAFFRRYHAASLDEICLFVDNEAWMPVASFTNVLQLQEFRSMKASLQRHLSTDLPRSSPKQRPQPTISTTDPDDQPTSLHSQDGGGSSSMYGSCGYFYRFAEKSSPFDGGFDETMLEEDILAGIADESSCYFSEESEEERTGLGGGAFGDPSSGHEGTSVEHTIAAPVVVSNSSLNVLRCIGRYLQMCRLFHSIAPNIVASMTELIDFYTFVVHDVFGNDLPVPSENLYTTRLTGNLHRIGAEVMPKVRNWPPSFSMIQMELCNAESMYGMQQRGVAVESAISLVQQFAQLRGYLTHLLPASFRTPLLDYLQRTKDYICDLRTPVFMCVTARAIDLQNVLNSMAKVRWDINHVNVEHSAYVDSVNRGIQMFAMRLEEFAIIPAFPKTAVWESLAHVLTHTLVEGYANAKKCSAAGRALMQLDFAHFMSILELTSGVKHPVHRAYVDAYIKAYYMPTDLLADWCRDQQTNGVYSNKQLTTLVQAVCANDKKSRQRLLQMLDQQDMLNSSGRSEN